MPAQFILHHLRRSPLGDSITLIGDIVEGDLSADEIVQLPDGQHCAIHSISFIDTERADLQFVALHLSPTQAIAENAENDWAGRMLVVGSR